MSDQKTDIRVATIGTSVITSGLAAAVAETPGIRVEAVYSRDGARAAEKAGELGAAWSSDSLDDLLASPDIDAVYVASPNSAHAAQVARAIDAGKHVLVEKPAVVTADEWLALVARAQDAGVVLLEAMRTEYDPGMALVRSLLPEIGVLRTASLRYQKRSSRYDQVLAGERVNMFDPAFAGGAVNDLGVYCIHAMVTLFGIPDKISSASVPIASGVDGAGALLATYPGMVVDLAYSKITTTEAPSEIHGETGTLSIDDISAPRTVRLLRPGAAPVSHVVPPTHAMRGEVERFVELITTGADASHDHALTEQTLRIVEEAREG